MRFQKLVFGILMVIFLTSTYLIIDDRILFSGDDHNWNKKELAIIDSVHKDVRKRNSDDFVWMPARKTGKVYEEDKIFTGKSSTAVIGYQGSRINLSENSLVTLGSSAGTLVLDLSVGELSGTFLANSKVIISSGSAVKIFSNKTNSRLKLIADESGNEVLTVLSGEVEVRVSNKKIKLKKNMQASFSSEMVRFKVGQRTITLTSPQDKTVLWKKNQRKIKFVWKGFQIKTQYKLQIATDPEMKNIVRKSKTTKLSATFVKVPVGRYYWRVSAKEGKSEIRELQYLSHSKPTPQIPRQGSFIPIGKILKLEWNDPNKTGKYQLQLSRDQFFKRVVIDQQQGNKHYSPKNLSTGKYFWRISSMITKSTKPEWSSTSSFTVFEFKKTELISPDEKQIIMMKNYKAPASFSWTKDIHQMTFIFELSKSRSFERLLEKEKTRKDQISFSFKKLGTFYWRVKKLTPDKKIVDISPTRTIKITMPLLDAPSIEDNRIKHTMKHYVLNPKGNIQSLGDSLALEWGNIPNAKFYNIKIYLTKTKRMLIDKNLNMTMYLWDNLKPGSYYWTVKAIDRFNRMGNKSQGTITVRRGKK